MSARQKLETQLTENNIVKEVFRWIQIWMYLSFFSYHLYWHYFVAVHVINNYVAACDFRSWVCWTAQTQFISLLAQYWWNKTWMRPKPLSRRGWNTLTERCKSSASTMCNSLAWKRLSVLKLLQSCRNPIRDTKYVVLLVCDLQIQELFKCH